MRPKLMNASQSLNLASKLMDQLGFIQHSSSSKESKYFYKKGSPHKIRFSTHEPPRGQSDVLHNEIIEDFTIEDDIKFRVTRASRVYENWRRNCDLKAERGR